MIDPGFIGLIVSGVVAIIQIFSFFDARSLRKEQNENTFAKADLVKTDLDAIRTSIDEKINQLFSSIEEGETKFSNIQETINVNATDIAVIKERITHDKDVINKLDEKLDRILDKI